MKKVKPVSQDDRLKRKDLTTTIAISVLSGKEVEVASNMLVLIKQKRLRVNDKGQQD